MIEKNTSTTYKILRRFGIYLSPTKYGQFTFTQFLKSTFRLWKNEILHKFARNLVILEPFSSRPIRAILHRWRGVKMGKGVFIGLEVMFDSVYPDRIHIGNGCILTNRVQILAHNRDLTDYGPGIKIGDCGYIVKDVFIEDNVVIGIDSVILPGVRIGTGAVIAAKSLVNKDVPPFTMVAGSPAKVIKTFSPKDASST